MNKRFSNWKKPKIQHGKLTKYNWIVYHPERLKLGNFTDIGALTAIFAHYGVEIGDNVQIGGGCFIYSLSTISADGRPIAGRVIIGKGAQIGAQSTIMPGVTIGANALVAAHSFVNKDVPAGATVAGVPAKIIKPVPKIRTGLYFL